MVVAALTMLVDAAAASLAAADVGPDRAVTDIVRPPGMPMIKDLVCVFCAPRAGALLPAPYTDAALAAACEEAQRAYAGLATDSGNGGVPEGDGNRGNEPTPSSAAAVRPVPERVSSRPRRPSPLAAAAAAAAASVPGHRPLPILPSATAASTSPSSAPPPSPTAPPSLLPPLPEGDAVAAVAWWSTSPWAFLTHAPMRALPPLPASLAARATTAATPADMPLPAVSRLSLHHPVVEALLVALGMLQVTVARTCARLGRAPADSTWLNVACPPVGGVHATLTLWARECAAHDTQPYHPAAPRRSPYTGAPRAAAAAPPRTLPAAAPSPATAAATTASPAATASAAGTATPVQPRVVTAPAPAAANAVAKVPVAAAPAQPVAVAVQPVAAAAKVVVTPAPPAAKVVVAAAPAPAPAVAAQPMAAPAAAKVTVATQPAEAAAAAPAPAPAPTPVAAAARALPTPAPATPPAKVVMAAPAAAVAPALPLKSASITCRVCGAVTFAATSACESNSGFVNCKCGNICGWMCPEPRCHIRLHALSELGDTTMECPVASYLTDDCYVVGGGVSRGGGGSIGGAGGGGGGSSGWARGVGGNRDDGVIDLTLSPRSADS